MNQERRTKLLQAAAGAAFLVLAIVLVLIVVNASSGDGGDTEIDGAAEVNRHLRGIPQQGLVLGDPDAPVEVVEFGDLQCPACAAYTEQILPPVIAGPVKRGEAKISFRNFAIIDEDSVPAGAAALAAGAQGRGWNFVELFYRNQGEEGSGYADDDFLEAVAKAAGVKDLAKWNADRADLEQQVEETSEEAQQLGFTGTPSFAIQGPKTNGLEPLGTPNSSGDLEEAIEAAS